MNKLVKDFYKIVNCIIKKIISNEEISNKLFGCKYFIFNQKTKELNKKNNKIQPLIFCLGGMAYQSYYNIINKYYQNIILESKTDDYDISLSLINDSDIEFIIKSITEIFDECIKNYQFVFEDENKRIHKINKTNFIIENILKKDRLQIKINCKYASKNFHILELCFWLNGKISDNYTINDFKKNKLFIYIDKDGFEYYLLPLEKLIKTTYYAMLDNYERKNYSKCNKYLDRIRYIKLTYDEYSQSDKTVELLNHLYNYYFEDIYYKYKIMYDYPFINSKVMLNIKDNEITKCVIRELRTNNHKTYIENIKKFTDKCEKNKDVLKYDEITEEDTEKDLKN
jgi:hypothetical protein